MQLSLPRSTAIAAFLRRWQLPILGAITLLAAILRFYDLPQMPPGLHVDEAWAGVMARQVLRTGELTPFFPSNQGVEAMVVYLTVPVVALLGDPIWQIRIPEAVAGTLTVIAIWWMCRELYGRRSARAETPPTEGEFVYSSLLGLGSALILSILFWHINLSRIGLEPILVPLFMCVSFATLARALATGRWWDFALAGVVLAGNMYTYKAGYATPPLVALYLIYSAIVDKGLIKREWRHLGLMFGMAVAAYIPMIIFAIVHPEDFFLRFGSVTIESRFTPQINVGENFVKVLGMFFIYGDENQRYNIPGRPALDVFLAVLFLIGLGRTLFSLRDPRGGLPAVWLVVMSLPTMLSEFAPQWGRAIGVTPVLALFSALGGMTLWQLAERAGRRWLSLATAGLVGLAVIASGVVAVRDYFVTFRSEPFLFYSFDEGTVKLSKYIDTVPATQRVYLVTPLQEYYTFIYIIDRQYETYDGRNGTVYPAPGQEATTVVILQRNQTMYRALRAARPDSTLVWTLNDRDDKSYARALHIPASDHPAPLPPHRVTAQLGDAIRLLGYDLDFPKAKPGQKVTLTVYWQALSPIKQDFTVFTHLLSDKALPSGDTFLTGNDRQPIAGTYPTSIWQPGEVILDHHLLTIPKDAPLGVYSLHVGMYLLATLERLPAVDGAGKPVPDNSIELGTVEVVPG